MGTGTDDATAAAAIVVLAGGSGTRVGAGLNKVYLPLAGRPILSWSLRWTATLPGVARRVLVVRPGDRELAEKMLRDDLPDLAVDLVLGGVTRHGSEQAALDHLAGPIAAGGVRIVAIHDGARPLAGPALFQRVTAAAAATGSAVPALPAPGLVPTSAAEAGPVPAPLPGRLVRVQTPQAFDAGALVRAYRLAADEGFDGTDTASTVERFGGIGVRVVPGSAYNLKVTYREDLLLAERLLAVHRGRMP